MGSKFDVQIETCNFVSAVDASMAFYMSAYLGPVIFCCAVSKIHGNLDEVHA